MIVKAAAMVAGSRGSVILKGTSSSLRYLDHFILNIC